MSAKHFIVNKLLLVTL